jgi:hypothetical protein
MRLFGVTAAVWMGGTKKMGVPPSIAIEAFITASLLPLAIAP